VVADSVAAVRAGHGRRIADEWFMRI